MSEKIKSAWPHIVFKVCVFASLLITSIFLLITGFDTIREYHFGYKENGNIDYAVNLIDGNFFNESALASGEISYSDVIKDILATFQYGVDFTDEVSGEYYYYVAATVVAEKDDGEKVWTKNYQISDPIVNEVTNSKSIRISTMQTIDYRKFDGILRQFINEYQTKTIGALNVSLVVKGDFSTEAMNQPATLSSSIDLSMPLAKESIKISVATNTKNDGKIYTKRVNIDNDRHLFCRFAGAMLIIAIIYLAINLMHIATENRKKHIYEYSVNKIREEYDSIIVDLKTAPKIAKLHIAHVRDFDELLDVYNSIKQPINYYESKDGAHFILINGRLAWQYVIPKNRTKKTALKHRSSRRRK